MVKYGTICLEKHELMFSLLENQYSDMCLRSFHSIEWQLQPSTNNYTIDLEGIKVAFRQTKYWGLPLLHIGNTVY